MSVHSVPVPRGIQEIQKAPEKAVTLTSWKKEPELTSLKADLALSIPAHDTCMRKVERWRDLRNITGSARPKAAKNRSRVQPMLVRRQAEWRYSALTEAFLSAPKLFSTEPKSWEDTEAARQNDVLLDDQFHTKINRVRFIDEYVRTNVDEGTVAVRVGWSRVERPLTKMVTSYSFFPLQDQPSIEAFMQAATLVEEDPSQFGNMPEELQEAILYFRENQIPVRAEAAGLSEVETFEVKKNQPTVEVLDIDNVFIDPTCGGDMDKARFAIIAFETSKAELLEDGRYENLEAVLWTSNAPATHPEFTSKSSDPSQQFDDTLRKRVVAYEYWGFRDITGEDRLEPIVATWIGDTLIRMEKNPYPDEEIPIVLVPYMPVKGQVTGEPDAELLGENQAIQGAISRGIIDLMGRSANGQTGMAKGMLDAVNWQRFKSGQDYEFNPGLNPQQNVVEHKFPEIPQSALTVLQMQDQDAEALTGVKAFSGGLSGEAFGEVAAGIRGMIDASAKREMAILRRLAEGMARIGRKILKMNQMFLSEEEVVRLTNKEFVKVRREEIQGEFDIRVDIATAEIEETKARDLAFMLQTLGNNMPLEMTSLLLGEIARLKRMPELAHRIETFKPEPDPLEVRKRELELQKLELELQELRSKAALNMAKAKQATSDADMKDLAFVETESGTSHARSMEKQGAQARANMQLEALKGAINAAAPNGDATSR